MILFRTLYTIPSMQIVIDTLGWETIINQQLNLDFYFSDLPSIVPSNFDFSQLTFRDGIDESSIPVDPCLYTENWIEFRSKITNWRDPCRSMYDYYGHYCAKDATILTEAFTNYCDSFIKRQGVNPLEHFSLPSMASAILWKHYDYKINKPYSFGKKHAHLSEEIRKNIMGGLSTVFCRHAEVGGEKRYDDVVHTVPNGNPIKKIDCVDFNSKSELIKNIE